MRAGRRWSGFAWRAVAGLGVIGLLAAVLDLGEIWRVMTSADPVVVVFASLLMLAGLPFASRRWSLILAAMGVRLAHAESFRFTSTAMLVALGLPSGQGGDIVRGAMLATDRRTSVETIVSSTVADRLYGLVSMGLLALPGAMVIAERTGGLAGVVFCALVLAGVPVFVVAMGGLQRWIARWDGALAARVAQVATELWTAFRSVRVAVPAMLCSLAIHSLAIVAAWLLGREIGIEAPVWSYVALVPLVWVITMIPVSIGGLGVREASFAALFGGIGVPAEQGAALGALVSVTSILGVIAGGALAMALPRGRPE